MGLKVLLFGGSGRFGSFAARRLAASGVVSGIGLAGRTEDTLRRVASEVGDKAHVVRLDARDEHRVAAAAKDYDVVTSAAGPETEVLLPALRGAIEAGAHYTDLGGVGRVAESQLAFDAAAKDRNVVAIIGLGTNPGMTNLLALHASRRLERVEELRACTFWNMPSMEAFHPAKALEGIRGSGRVDALWQTVLTIASGPVTIYRDGRWTAVEPAEHPTDVTVPGGGTATAYPLGTSEPITMPRFLPGVRTVVSVWSLFPPQLNGLYHREARRIAREGRTPADSARSFLEAIVLEEDRWLKGPTGYPAGFLIWAEAIGSKDGRRARVACWPVRAPTSTTLTLVIGTLRILREEVPQRGVFGPEAVFEPESFLEEAAQQAKEQDLEKPLLGESLEWLE